MEKIKFGIIGAGNQGTLYSEKIFGAGKIENGVVSAICDTNPKKIEILKGKLNDDSIVYFNDYIEMLDKEVERLTAQLADYSAIFREEDA